MREINNEATGKEKVVRRSWLSNSVSKKGPHVLAWSIGLPNERCPFASAICSKYCYAMTGQFTLHKDRYRENFELSKSSEFVESISTEIVQFAETNANKKISVAVHEKGEFYSLEYIDKWNSIMGSTGHLGNVNYFIYTRSWRSPAFRNALEQMVKDHKNVRINLSVDRDMVERFGVPNRIGNGLITYLAETDQDIPPLGVDLVFRNLRAPHDGPMEQLGEALVCPNESDMYIAINGNRPALQKGKCKRVRCQECRLCIDRSLNDWNAIKSQYEGVPGQIPNIIRFPYVDKDQEAEVA